MNIYFAYGSNLDERQMRNRCPYYEKIGIGYIKNYELCFPKISKKWGGMGVASIRYKENASVEGVLYLLNNEDLRKMDKYEGGYSRVKMPIIIENDSLEAYTYLVNKNQDVYYKPSYEYIQQIYESAKRLNLNENYISSLKKFF